MIHIIYISFIVSYRVYKYILYDRDERIIPIAHPDSWRVSIIR